MPEIFSKDCKINVIEYGSHQTGLDSMHEIKNKISRVVSKILGK